MQEHFLAALVLALTLAACGGGGTRSGTTSVEETSGPSASHASDGPRDEELACTRDDECVAAPPGACCASYCAEDARAWRRDAWERQQQVCAVVECEVREEPACRGDPPPPPPARCVDGACALVR